MKKLIIFLFIALNTGVYAQSVSINTNGDSPDNSAILDVKSTTKGMLVPRMTSLQRDALFFPADGLLVYDTDTQSFWYYADSDWVDLSKNFIADFDLDTKIEVEQAIDEDSIKFTIAGFEFAKMDGKTFHLSTQDSSLFIGQNSGLHDDGSSNKSTGVGFETLKNDATGWNNTALGYQALSQQDAGDNNTAVGAYSMWNTHYGDFNVAVGTSTLYNNTSGGGNVAVGHRALNENINGKKNVAVGHLTMEKNTTGELNVAIGANTLHENVTSDHNIAIGDSALFNNGSGTLFNSYEGEDNIAIGINSGLPITRGHGNILLGNATYSEGDGQGQENTIVGHNAGKRTGVGENVMIGAYSGENFADGEANVFVGNYAGQNNVDNSNVFVGHSTGRKNEGGGNVFLGYKTGENDKLASNTLMIDNTNTSSPLIYGEFDNNLVKINGQLNINDEFTFPMADGTNDQILKTDGNGILTWEDINSKEVSDADNDTRVTVENSPDEDQIKMYLAGTPRLFLRENATGDLMIEPIGGYGSTFLGRHAGQENIGTGSVEGNNNTFIGYKAGQDNQDGDSNTYLGSYAGEKNETGANNTFLGFKAGQSNSGWNNVLIGHEVGTSGSFSNRLYIDNSNTTSPLIYGDFTNDKLRINGELEIGTAYSFPEVDGASDQVLKTDGSGNVSWENDDSSELWEENSGIGIHYPNIVGIGNPSPTKILDVFSFDDGAKIKSGNLFGGSKKGLDIEVTRLSSISTVDSLIGLKTLVSESEGLNIGVLAETLGNDGEHIALIAKSGNASGHAAKFDGKVELGTSHSTNNQVLIAPNSNSGNGGDASLFLSEDRFANYGMYWEYDGGVNEIRLFGYQDGVIHGSHISVERDDGIVSIGSNDAIVFNPDLNGNSRVITDELEIRGGSDLSEFFTINNTAVPGMIVAIDPNTTGGLQLSPSANSKLVVGVVSGANGIKTGMLMGQDGSIADGDTPVALAGRVYVKVNNENGDLKPGDFITSSSIPGEGMKVIDMQMSQGAIIGKAMTAPDKNDFVLVLVNLQ